jgi:hypothetical protein
MERTGSQRFALCVVGGAVFDGPVSHPYIDFHRFHCRLHFRLGAVRKSRMTGMCARF